MLLKQRDKIWPQVTREQGRDSSSFDEPDMAESTLLLTTTSAVDRWTVALRCPRRNERRHYAVLTNMAALFLFRRG